MCLYVYSLKRKSRVLFVLYDFYFVLHVLQKEHYFILFCMFDISSWVGTQHVFLESKSKREKKISINNIDSNIDNEQSLFFLKSWKRWNQSNLIQNQVIMYQDEHDLPLFCIEQCLLRVFNVSHFIFWQISSFSKQ